jgi:hypothetical protein
MLVKKTFSLVMALTVALSLIVVPKEVFASSGSFPVIFDFESDNSGWELGTSKDAELSRENEDNNYFLRLTAKSGADYMLNDNIDIVPNGYVNLTTPYIMEPNSEIVISADVRMNESKLIRNFMINRDQLNDEVNDEVQYNFATLWNWNKGKIYTFDLTQSASVGGYKKAKSNLSFLDILDNNKWYTFSAILSTDNYGLPEYIELVVSDGAAINLTSGKRTIVNETLRLSNKITRLDFDLANAKVTLTEDAVFDIDNIKIYQNTDDRFCRIKSNNEGNVFNGSEKISLSFNAPMDPATINTENIELYDSNNSKIDYSGSYNDNLWEYTITPNETLASGVYTIKISNGDLDGIRQDKSIIQGMSSENEAEQHFVIFGGKLPEVKNLSISGKNLEGQTIASTGEFYQESGLDGHLTYQWWYSTSENGDYVKIDGATNSTFTVPSGFINKYIRVSVIPITDDNTIRGEETFSNIILPPSKPIIKDFEINGELIEYENLVALGEFYQEDGLSGYLKYQWWYSNSENGTYVKIDGETGKNLIVTSGFTDKYIKVSVTPIVDGDLIVGEEVFSNTISPLSKPYAQDVRISGLAISGMTISLEYTFVDENSDKEAKSLYEWFVSPDGMSTWTKIYGETSKDYVVSEGDVGKYIKAQVTPISVKDPRIGNPVQTNIIGPIKSIDSINLVTNPGFEGGVSTGWNVKNMGGDNATVTATKEDSYSGEWCGRFEGQTVNSTFMVYRVNMNANTKYLETCMMKVAPDSAIDNVSMSFYGEDNPPRNHKFEQNIIKKDGWYQVTQMVSIETDGSFSEMPQHWPNGTPGYAAYIDDLYIAPLLVYDIKANVPESINIPLSGETSSSLSVLAIQNQIGTTFGVENETAYWELDEDVDGAYIKDNKLYVTSNAKSGMLKLKAVCEPQFDDAAQRKFIKVFPINLVTNSNKTPRIINANLSGNTSNLSTLRLDYSFYQIDNSDDASIIKWYSSDTIDGTYTDTNVTGMSFNVTSEFLGKYVKAQITPIDSGGREGQAVYSNIAGPKTKPEAKDVVIKGNGGYVGDVVKSEYTYYDLNGDEEGNTKFQWWRSSSETGTYKKIAGAEEDTYTITENDANCYIKLSVRPVSKKEPCEGIDTFSNAIIGPRAPYAKSVSISEIGNTLIGKYLYANDNGTEEGETICQWLINGNVVGTGTRYEPHFNVSTTVEFRVTPVAVKAPAIGESVSATKTVSVVGGTSGGSGGGTKGGGAATSWVFNTIIPNNTLQNNISDIQNHWSQQYAQKAIENGIMRTNENGMFEPDRNVTRAEIVEYIFKTMNYTETEYRGEFSDVSGDMSYANILQTLVDRGIISKDEKFRPDDNVSRQEVCRIISLALGLESTGEELDTYSDKDEVGDWAAQHVKNMISAGIMTGISKNEFSPKTNITNGQMARIVVAIMENDYNH